MKRKRSRKIMAAGASLGCALTGVANGQDLVRSLEPMTVVGSQEDVREQVGSAAYIPAEEIRDSNLTNINQILAKVPGAYIREEDGFGNFPNISLRGADGTRSAKVTVMEDGILSAPGPYSAPAAYYTPKVARMSGLEVLKGSSQVRYGPQTTAGVINYLSTPIPGERTTYAKATYGSYGTLFGHVYSGDTVDTEIGKLGYLFELHGNSSDGFRDTDGGGDTGFALFEPMLKLSLEPETALKQRIEFKAGFTDFDANETYVGLREQDLRQDPDRRYAGSRMDEMRAEQARTYLKWIAEPSDKLRLESAVYYNGFERDWFKADQADGQKIHEVLAPGATGADLAAFGVLAGTAPGEIRLKGNAREYAAYGWQNQANFLFETGEVQHDLAVGLRIHEDYEARNQYTVTYQGDGAGNFTPITGKVPVTSEHDRSQTIATAVYVEDTVRMGALTLRPGFRYEWLNLDYVDKNDSTNNLSGTNEIYTAGIGANYDLTEANSVFGGIYRGVSLPSVKSSLSKTNPVDEEETLGYELGARHREGPLRAELVGFFTDFKNLISTDTGLGGVANQNAGKAEVWGFESVVEYDIGEAAGLGFGLPAYVSATWTSAQFKGTTASLAGGGDGIYAGGSSGNEIPYVPEWRLAAGIGYEAESWGVNLDANFTDATWGTGYNDDPRPGTPTSRDGKIDSLFLVDLNMHYQVNEHVRLLAGVQNLFDQRKIVSRIPEGPRANAPRMLFAGVEATF